MKLNFLLSCSNQLNIDNSQAMPDADKTYRIFLSAAEPSADAHCASLITILKRSPYNIEFVGVGGPKMAAAGCELLETTITRAVMMLNALHHLGFYYKLIRRIARFLKDNKPDLVVVCDSPAFNFHVAKAAKKAGFKTLFYVAPQLWSWAGWRIRKLRKCCDKLCCILPFEQDWFGDRGVDAVFVGNPMLDELDTSPAHFRREYADFKPESAHFAIMPGSRTAEINTLWQPMQQIAIRLKRKYPNATFTAVAVDAERQKTLKNAQIPGFECKYIISSVTEAARLADFAIVASGSATLQVAAAGCPMVIMYQTSRILWYLLGWWLLKIRYFSLVNILANSSLLDVAKTGRGRQLVPEFMPYFKSIDPIVETIENLVDDPEKLAETSAELVDLAQSLTEKKACKETAAVVIDMLK